MIIGEEIKNFREDMSADDKAEALLEELKGLKDYYDAVIQNLERRMDNIEVQSD